jgi:ribosomal protein S16
MDKEAVEKYLKNGAQPSGRVALILKKNGVKLPKWVKLAPKKDSKAKHADKLRKNQPKEEPVAEEPISEAPAEAQE